LPLNDNPRHQPTAALVLALVIANKVGYVWFCLAGFCAGALYRESPQEKSAALVWLISYQVSI